MTQRWRTITVHDVEWLVTADMAMPRTKETDVLAMEPPVEPQMLVTTVYEKVDGRWMVGHMHYSEGP